jgi:uncharacterized hydrophobic protein (TIGR00271 family)
MGWIECAIAAGGGERNSLADVEEGLFVDIGDTRAKLSQFWVLLVLSSLIAAGGVIGNSTPAVIGAMIVAPLATPIYGVALATVIGSPKRLRTALLLLIGGIAVNIALGVVVGLITFERMPLSANPQITGRTSPTMLDLGVAVATGVAGSFALARRDVVNILAGVAIAISLVPVLAVVGITLGAGEFAMARGALFLFGANVAAILISGVLVFGAAGYARAAGERDPRVARRARVLIAVFVVVVLVPLAMDTLRTWRYERWTSATGDAAAAWVADTPWQVASVADEGGTIVVTVRGSGATPPLDSLRASVRRSVPDRVKVELVESNGATTDL